MTFRRFPAGRNRRHWPPVHRCQRQGQPSNKLFELCDALWGFLFGVFIRRGKHRGFHIFNDLLLPLGKLFIAEVVATTQFCLGTLTAECFKNNFRFKLGCESSSFSLGSPSDAPFSKIVFYHNLGLERGPNFRWQYTFIQNVTLQETPSLLPWNPKVAVRPAGEQRRSNHVYC